MNKPIRHGDVLLVPAKARGTEKKRRGDLIIMEGEQTGHAHRIADPGAIELVDGDTRFLRVLAEAGVSLTHEEHHTLTIPAGDYEIRRQRENDPWEGLRYVAD